MDRSEIFRELKRLASYFSFGRIIGYISFFESYRFKDKESIELIGYDNKEPIMSSEKDLLCGLWLSQIDLKKESWTIDKDDEILDRVYDLMSELHKTYNSEDFTTFYKGLAFYEGDEGYDWQFIKFAKQKFNSACIKKELLSNNNFNIDYINSTYNKLKSIIEKQIKERRSKKAKCRDYLSPLNMFVIRENKIKKNFQSEELAIIQSMTISLGNKEHTNDINDIGDYNVFRQFPIINLKGRGLFIPNFLTLSMSLNESPYYWLNKKDKEINMERGKNAENIISKIIEKKFSVSDIIRDKVIKKNKTGNEHITDIDILLKLKDTNIIFQIKSKKLNLSSRQGDYDSVNKDFKQGVDKAYEQGIKCVQCLKDYTNYISLRDINKRFLCNEKYIIVCITVEIFPTITSYSIQYSKPDFPMVAMTAYDLDSIFDVLSPNEIYNYFNFRVNCLSRGIFGINEMYYLGAFVISELGFQIRIYDNGMIDQMYAKIADSVMNAKYFRYARIDCIEDIGMWIYKNKAFYDRLLALSNG